MSTEPDFDWFEVREFEHGVIGIGEPGHFEDVKSYLIVGAERAVLFDTGMGIANIKAVVEHFTDLPVIMINSHGHLDHIGDNWRFEHRWAHPLEVERIQAGVPNERMREVVRPEAFNRPPPADLVPATFTISGTGVEREVDEGDEIDLGGRVLTVLHTPGHSAGSISLLEDETGILFPGDAIYEGPLFAHHPDASPKQYRATIQRLAELVPQLTVVYPSHNRYPIEASFITEVADAMDGIWNGNPVDTAGEGRVQWDFGRFSISFREGWQDE